MSYGSPIGLPVSKLFRAYGLYNDKPYYFDDKKVTMFQSSFELTGYITIAPELNIEYRNTKFQSSFELTGYITPSKRLATRLNY